MAACGSGFVTEMAAAVARLSVQMGESRERGEHDLRAHGERFASEMRERDQRFASEMRERDDRIEYDARKLDARLAASSEKLHRELGEIANKQGRLVEDMVEPSIARVLRVLLSLPEEAEIAPLAPRLRLRHPKDRSRMRELDVVAAHGDLALVVEVKSVLAPEQVTKFAASLEEAREYLAPLGIREVMGAVATLRVDPSIVTHASRLGLVVLAVGEELMVAKNASGFVARRV